MPMLTRLIYTSRAVDSFSIEQLDKIIKQATVSNALRDITGLLLYGNGYIMQILEGQAEEVDDLFTTRIKRDSRHTDFHVLLWERCDYRLFPHWAMGPAVLNPTEQACEEAWQQLWQSIGAQSPEADLSSDVAVQHLARFVRAFGDPIDQQAFSAWCSLPHARKSAS